MLCIKLVAYWNTWYGNVAEPCAKLIKLKIIITVQLLTHSPCVCMFQTQPGEGSDHIQEPLGPHLLQGKGVTNCYQK